MVTAKSNTKQRLLRAALWYANQGWAVLPLYWLNDDGTCGCGKDHVNPDGSENHSIAKHPLTPRGNLDASKDADQISQWWHKWPKANIGIATGAESGLVVLDIDPIHSGDLSLETIIEEHGALAPDTPQVETGSGGSHYYFLYPRQGEAGSRNGLAFGVDIKADGGYVVAPPSMHYLGREYRWVKNGPRKGQDYLVLSEPPAWAVINKRSGRRNGATPSVSANGNHPPKTSKAKIRPGERNSTLTSYAGSLRRSGLDGATIYDLLVSINERLCDPPLAEDELDRIAYGMERYAPEDRVFDMTDLGNAKRFILRHGNDVRYTLSHGWLYWTNYWQRDRTEQVMAKVIETVESIPSEAAEIEDSETQIKVLQWAKSSQTSTRLRGAQEIARSLPGIAMLPDEFDKNNWLLNVRNGTIDLQTGLLREHDRNDLITKMAPVDYDPDAQCPTFQRFLLEIMGDDAEVVEYLQRLFGYVITGEVSESIMPIFWGAGANGKTTLLNAIAYVLGTDYAGAAPPGLLIEKTSESHPTEFADLQGRRLITAAETGSGKKLAESAMKYLTGGDKIKARFMRQDFFEFVGTFKIILLTNNKPNVKNQDYGVWRRLKLVPFTVTFSDEEKDPELPKKLQAEASGILNWLLEGCLRWQAERLVREPEVIRTATADYKRESDVLADFRDDCVYFDKNVRTTKDNVFLRYRQWAEKQGIKQPYTKIGFGRLMAQLPQIADKPIWVKDKGTVRFWVGLGLKHSQMPDIYDSSKEAETAAQQAKAKRTAR